MTPASVIADVGSGTGILSELYEQRFDFEGLRGRLLSSSYAPLPDQPHYEPMMAELRRLFDIHEENGQIVFTYETHLYLGRVG